MRALLLLALVAGPATAENPERTAATENLKALERLNVPARLRYALATATSPNVRILAYEEKGGVKIVGEAKSFDDVSEFMRRLVNVAVCPAGMARVVERHRDGRFRVELMGSGVILDFSRAQVRFFFANLELKSAEVTGKAVRFELWRVAAE